MSDTTPDELSDQMQLPSESKAIEQRKQRLSYLLDLYKLYHGHINSMFNYFLITSGIIGTAYVQSSSASAEIHHLVPTCIALFGMVISYISLKIHQRSRALIDTIETGLREEELAMFKPGGGFLNFQAEERSWIDRHRHQFPLTYWLFIVAFALLATYAGFHSPEVNDPAAASASADAP